MIEECKIKGLGLKLRYDSGDSFVGQAVSKALYEPFESGLFFEKIKRGDIVFDVGANIGYYTLIAAKKMGLRFPWRRGKVYAFEPSVKNFSILSENVKINSLKNVYLRNYAVGEKDSFGKLYLSDDNLGDHRMSFVEGRNVEEVKVVSLDSFIEENTVFPDVVKIDTQGFDFYVLKGMEKFLKMKRSMRLFTEFWDFGNKKAGVDSREYFDFLKENFEKIYLIDEEVAKLRSICYSELMELCYVNDKMGHVNLYCERE